MKGTAILIQPNVPITVLEDIEKDQFNKMKDSREKQHPNISKDNTDASAIPIIWHEQEVDWDYGY